MSAIGKMKPEMVNRCIKKEHRDLLAFVLKHNVGARKMFQALVGMGARNIRPDYMLFRNATGTYERIDDVGAWNCTNRWGMSVCLIRHADGEWLLHS